MKILPPFRHVHLFIAACCLRLSNGSAIPGTGTAIAGSDYTAATGTLNWADGDSAVKPITITLLNNATFAASKSLSITLSGPTFGTLGAITKTSAQPQPNRSESVE